MAENKNVVEKIKPSSEIKKNIESGNSVETQIERGQERALETADKKQEKANNMVHTPPIQPVGGVIAGREQQTRKIEHVLQDGLKEMYLDMPDSKKQKFKYEGEKTAVKINQLINKTKINIKKIISLIKKWLLIIPGVNNFFIEQEAKIKADEIVKIKIEK